MTKNYGQLGFKCGIEIHQQLAGKKLFCACPCDIRKDKPHFIIRRRLRASAGETGTVDAAASHEQEKAKYFLYYAYTDTTCLVEFDEEPPHEINQQAVHITLAVCKHLHATVNNQAQFMRKIVIDGSNTTGFQRTTLIGRNGHITLDSGKKISIPTVCLEEEACQAVERQEDHDTYNLSRQGIPLIEIATGPDLTTPEEARECAEKIGMILRSVEGMKRGIGTIRQDVNVSIKGGCRVEIKGFQEYKSMPAVIDAEIDRQVSLIKKGKKPEREVRAVTPEFTTVFLRPMPGESRMYPETDVPLLTLDTSKIVVGKTLAQKEQELITSYNIQKDWAKEILRNNIPFEELAKRYTKISPGLIAETLLVTPKEIKARYKIECTFGQVEKALSLLNENKLPKSALFEVLVEYAQGKEPNLLLYASLADAELERIIQDTVKSHPGISLQGLMGLVMAKVHGKADGKKVMDLLKRHAT